MLWRTSTQQQSPFLATHPRPRSWSCCSPSSDKGRLAAQYTNNINMYEQDVTLLRKLISRWTDHLPSCYPGKAKFCPLPSSRVEILLSTSTPASWQLDHRLCCSGETCFCMQEGRGGSSAPRRLHVNTVWGWRRQHTGPGNAEECRLPQRPHPWVQLQAEVGRTVPTASYKSWNSVLASLNIEIRYLQERCIMSQP